MTLVFETLSPEIPSSIDYLKVAKQILDAIYYLHNYVDCTHGLIDPSCIVWSPEGDLKLSRWPVNLLTDGGFSLGSRTIFPPDVCFVAPEQVKSATRRAAKTCDIWSAGLTLLRLIKSTCKLPENPCRIAFCDSSKQVLEQIDGQLTDNVVSDPSMWNLFFQRALEPDPALRATMDELYSILHIEKPILIADQFKIPLDVGLWEKKAHRASTLDIGEIYFLWRLSIGRNFESEQRQDDYPPIFKIPYLIVTERQSSCEVEPQLLDHIIMDTNSKLIPLEKFKADVDQLERRIFHPLVMTDIEYMKDDTFFPSSSTDSGGFVNLETQGDRRKLSRAFTFADLDTISIESNIKNRMRESSKTLPVVIKEANFAYQCERMMLFKRLLNSYPFLRDQLIREASVDIPPYYRAQVWATLLNVDRRKSEKLYQSIDKSAPVGTERQINVDIPRCHQYNDLMASPQGHQKLARVLKAWLNHNSSDYVYWQGLDSLVAPFLLLNFDNEAMAFACFNAFVDKYLRGMFQKENQLIVQQYLTMFSELLSYHDASLASHLEKLGFLPNLYAIPWFLTMFTHVLPLHKILHIWDCLMLGDEKFPLCIGLAILNQLRDDLMGFSFNDCLGMFSDLPEIDIEKCIRDANHFYSMTPDKLINLK